MMLSQNYLLNTWSMASPRSLRANAMLMIKGNVSAKRLVDVSRNPIAKELISCRDEESF